MTRLPNRTIILTAFVIIGFSGLATGTDKPNVVIQWGHSSPDTAYVRRHAEWLERRPFDGVAMTIDPRDAEWLDQGYWDQRIEHYRSKESFGYLVKQLERPREKGSLSWGGGGGLSASGDTGPWNPNNLWTEETIAKALADLKATTFKRFRFNLVETYIQAPTTDWFDDEEWAQRCHNFAMVAKLAKQAGLKGILFDDEQYGAGEVWSYVGLRKRKAVHDKSLAETQAMARQRGQEFAQAICKEFPDIVIWTLHGYSTLALMIENGYPEYARYLKPAFYDGMLEGSSDGMILVDGGEIAYGYNTKEQFQWGRKAALELPISTGLTLVSELHRKKVRCGFGLWPDYYGKIDPDDPENSYFSPGRFQRALNLALQISDGYVWIYGQAWTWWVEGPNDRAAVDIYQGKRGLPLAYWRALEAGHSSPGSDTSPVKGMHTVSLPSGGRHNCVDGRELPKFLENAEKVFELPVKGLTFKLDDWADPSDDPATFDQPMMIGKRWDEQGVAGLDMIGWYRLEFTLPEKLKDRKLHFYFPDVDGSVWLSSRSAPRPQGVAHRYVGLEPESNRKPFVLTHEMLSVYMFEAGKPAVMVLKVQASKGAGGILAPIEVLATPGVASW